MIQNNGCLEKNLRKYCILKFKGSDFLLEEILLHIVTQKIIIHMGNSLQDKRKNISVKELSLIELGSKNGTL